MYKSRLNQLVAKIRKKYRHFNIFIEKMTKSYANEKFTNFNTKSIIVVMWWPNTLTLYMHNY